LGCSGGAGSVRTANRQAGLRWFHRHTTPLGLIGIERKHLFDLGEVGPEGGLQQRGVSEVAAALRVHPRSIQRWARDGRFASVRVGKEYRIPRADVLRWLHNASIPGSGLCWGDPTPTPARGSGGRARRASGRRRIVALADEQVREIVEALGGVAMVQAQQWLAQPGRQGSLRLSYQVQEPSAEDRASFAAPWYATALPITSSSGSSAFCATFALSALAAILISVATVTDELGASSHW
jgi:excisionase family DNA binding protein